VTALALALLLVTPGMPPIAQPDAGLGWLDAGMNRSAEDQEVIGNLELLEHLLESQSLDVLLDMGGERPKPQ
jgi:hypothetical protein